MVILGSGWALAALTSRIVTRVLFDWTGWYGAAALVARLGYGAVLLFTLRLAFHVFGPNPISDLLAAIVHWLPTTLAAAAVVLVAAAFLGGTTGVPPRR